MASLILLLACGIIVVHAEVFIVLMHGDPVVHNKATSPEPGRKLDSSSYHVQAYASYLTEQHDVLLETTFGKASYRKLYSYNHLIHGFAVDLTEDQAAALRLVNGVKLVTKERRFSTLTTFTPALLGLETGAWPTLGGVENSGEGIVIGIVDTGIDPLHPSFSATTQNRYQPVKHFTGTCQASPDFSSKSCNEKIVAARYFSASAEMNGNKSEVITSVLDTVGHGSHTASTAAGNHNIPVVIDGINYGNASGVAPRARTAVYKPFFGDQGYASDILAAIEQAVRDGADVISLSLGSKEIPKGPSVFTDLFEQTLLSAVHAGVFVVQAAGNYGPDKSTVTSYSPWVMTVGATNTGRGYRASVELGNGERVPGLGLSKPTSPGTKYPLVMAEAAYTGSKFSTSSCTNASEFNRSLVKGKIFVCKYSVLESLDIPRVLQVAKAAEDLGAVGFIMLLDPSSKFSDYMTTLYPIPIPGIVIDNVNASQEVLAYFNSKPGSAVARISENTVEFNRTAPVVLDFSSRGPNVFSEKKDPVDVLKPNIVAPGNAIWAAWSKSASTQAGREFALLSGTSMSTPHVAGAAALMKQKHPNWTPAAISSALMTTASIVDSKGQVLGALQKADMLTGTPFDYGAGFINVTAAMDPGIVFDAGYQDYVAFLCSLEKTKDWKDVVKASAHTDCATELDNSYNLNSPSITVSRLKETVVVRRTVTSVTNVVETYTAALVQPQNVAAAVAPASFTLKPNESASFTLSLQLPRGKLLPGYVFGQLTLQGDKGHRARIFITVASELGSSV